MWCRNACGNACAEGRDPQADRCRTKQDRTRQEGFTGMSVEMSVPRVGIHRLIDAGRRLQKYEDQPCVCTGKTWNRKNSLIARSCEKNPAGIWSIDFVQRIAWFGDNPCRKYTENQRICDRKNLRKIQKIIRFMHSQYRKYKENYGF